MGQCWPEDPLATAQRATLETPGTPCVQRRATLKSRLKCCAGKRLILKSALKCFGSSICLFLLLALPLAASSSAQKTRPKAAVVPATAGGQVSAAAATVLHSLGSRAAVIFSGRVLDVQVNRPGGYVDVTFQVDRALRGCGGSSRYVLREWAGLWGAGEDRYPIGSQLLMLLSARGPSGMSAPVGGTAGMIRLTATRQPPLLHGAATAPAYVAGDEVAAPTADLRWVEALAERGTQSPAIAPGGRAEAHEETAWRAPAAMVKARNTGVAASQPGLDAVLNLLSQTAPGGDVVD